MLGWTRRRVLRGLLHGAGAIAFFPGWLRASATACPPPLRQHLAGLLPDTAAAVAIAAAYLTQVPDAAQRTRALGRLLRDQPDAAACRVLLRRRRSRDFELEDLVLFDGWVLAATEAQLCALARCGGPDAGR